MNQRFASRVIQKFFRDQRGALAIEFLLVIPVLVILFLGLFEIISHCWVSTKGQRMVAVIASTHSRAHLASREAEELLRLAPAVLQPFGSRALRIYSVRLDPPTQKGARWSVSWNVSYPEGGKLSESMLAQLIDNVVQYPVVVTFASFDYQGLFMRFGSGFTGMNWVSFAMPGE